MHGGRNGLGRSRVAALEELSKGNLGDGTRDVRRSYMVETLPIDCMLP
jgi:hypothetical protein